MFLLLHDNKIESILVERGECIALPLISSRDVIDCTITRRSLCAHVSNTELEWLWRSATL